MRKSCSCPCCGDDGKPILAPSEPKRMFSRSTGYALEAMAYLASRGQGRLTGAREIAGATGIPMPFLWKVLRHLSRSNLVRSSKGVRGGYELARPAERIPLIEVVEATQRDNPVTYCVLGLNLCSDERPCILHASCAPLREALQSTVMDTTLADLISSPTAKTAPKKRKRRKASGK